VGRRGNEFLRDTQAHPRPSRFVARSQPSSREAVPSANQLLDLQRRVGNRAAVSWLSSRTTQPTDLVRDASTAQQVQRLPTDEELIGRGNEIEDLSKTAPTSGGDIWHFTDSKSTELYIIGTMHGPLFRSMPTQKQERLFDFLTGTGFSKVYTEITSDLALNIPAMREAFQTLSAPEPPEGSPTREFAKRRILKRNASETLNLSDKLDDIYGALANKGAPTFGLETEKSRNEIRQSYAQSSIKNKEEQGLTASEEIDMETFVQAGDEKKIMGLHASKLKQGIDPQDIEARNDQWTEGVAPNAYHVGEKVLWIVGASHLGGLTLLLRQQGWTGAPHAI
jgi:hypothetical protein